MELGTRLITGAILHWFFCFAALKRGVRGKYAEGYRAGTNLVLLEPDVAKVFPSEKAVNEALRLVIQLTKIPNGKNRGRPNRSSQSASSS